MDKVGQYFKLFFSERNFSITIEHFAPTKTDRKFLSLSFCFAKTRLQIQCTTPDDFNTSELCKGFTILEASHSSQTFVIFLSYILSE